MKIPWVLPFAIAGLFHSCFACPPRGERAGFVGSGHEDCGGDREAGGQLGNVADVQVLLAVENFRYDPP